MMKKVSQLLYSLILFLSFFITVHLIAIEQEKKSSLSRTESNYSLVSVVSSEYGSKVEDWNDVDDCNQYEDVNKDLSDEEASDSQLLIRKSSRPSMIRSISLDDISEIDELLLIFPINHDSVTTDLN